MTFERFGMWVFAGIGRLLVLVGSLAVIQQFVVETSLADAFITALLYGGGLIGFGTVLGKLARLALNDGKPGPR